jgi:hypothetical protein
MDAASPKVRRAWRALVLVFVGAIVALRLAVAGGCGSTGGAAKATTAAKPTPPPRIPKAERTVFDPAYLPATKAGGGFFPTSPPEEEANQQAAPQRQAPSPR